jgi:2-hydroxy-6-oxonona-2,4-dienedioate hydrolase
VTETVWTALAGLDLTIRHVRVGEWNTRVLEAGTGPETLVLMHGTGGHLETYARNIAAFAGHYRVIAFDFPGHGYSTLTERDLEFDAYLTHLLGLLDTLGIERAHLNGESLGGAVAVKFAAAHPNRVGKLVLNTPGGLPARPEVLDRLRTLSQQAADDPSVERVRSRLEWLMADPASVTDELVAIRLPIYAQPGFARSMRHILCLQDPEIRTRNLITDTELSAIGAPTLVIWTSDNPSGPADAGRELASKLYAGRFELIDGAGHWPQWEQPDGFHDVVLKFLAEPTPPLEIEFLPPAASQDHATVGLLTELINQVYEESERGLWVAGGTRTTPAELAGMIRARTIAVARLAGHVVGCVRVQRLESGEGECGLLAADPRLRGIGIGRELLSFAEEACRRDGLTTMQLELLVPRHWTHPSKEFLASWYIRSGYRQVRTGSLGDDYPALAPLLATPCDFAIYHKDLTAN